MNTDSAALVGHDLGEGLSPGGSRNSSLQDLDLLDSSQHSDHVSLEQLAEEMTQLQRIAEKTARQRQTRKSIIVAALANAHHMSPTLVRRLASTSASMGSTPSLSSRDSSSGGRTFSSAPTPGVGSSPRSLQEASPLGAGALPPPAMGSLPPRVSSAASLSGPAPRFALEPVRTGSPARVTTTRNNATVLHSPDAAQSLQSPPNPLAIAPLPGHPTNATAWPTSRGRTGDRSVTFQSDSFNSVEGAALQEDDKGLYRNRDSMRTPSAAATPLDDNLATSAMDPFGANEKIAARRARFGARVANFRLNRQASTRNPRSANATPNAASPMMRPSPLGENIVPESPGETNRDSAFEKSSHQRGTDPAEQSQFTRSGKGPGSPGYSPMDYRRRGVGSEAVGANSVIGRRKSVFDTVSFDHEESVASPGGEEGAEGIHHRRGHGRSRGDSRKADRGALATTLPGVTALDAAYIVVAFAAVMINQVLFSVLHRHDNDMPAIVVCWFALLPVFSCGWMVSRFFVQTREGGWDVIDETPKIRRLYLKGWFLADLLVSLPLELIFMWNPTAAVFLGYRHLLRLFRCYTLTKHDNPLLSNRPWGARLMGTGVMASVIVGAILLVVYDADEIRDWWIVERVRELARTQNHSAPVHVGAPQDLNFNVPQLVNQTAERFALGFYIVTASMTSTGYGDFVMEGEGGRVLSMAICLTGLFIFSVLKALATGILTARDAWDISVSEKKRLLHDMLGHYDVPWNVQREIIPLFPLLLDQDHDQEFKKMIAALPPFVADKIEFFLRIKTLKGFPLLQSVHTDEMIGRLAQVLDRRFIPAYHTIIVQGEIGSEMYFLSHGIVEVMVEGEDGEERCVATLKTGSYFGEIALLEETTRMGTVDTIVDCEVLVLTKSDFELVVDAETREAIRQESLRRKESTTKKTRGSQSMS
jgi:hypothetical protein